MASAVDAQSSAEPDDALDAPQLSAIRKAASVVGHMLMAPSRSALGIAESSIGLTWHQEAREFVGTSLISWSDPKGSTAAAWIGLAHEQLGSHEQAAKRSLQRALRRQHLLSVDEQCHAHVLLAAIVMAHGRRGDGTRAERLLRAALTAVPNNPHALWRLGQLLIYRGETAEGEMQLGRALDALAHSQHGQLNAAAPGFVEPEGARCQRAVEAAADAAAFADFCAAASTALSPELRTRLPQAVLAIKELPRTREWLLRWGSECARCFSPLGGSWNAAAYGETPFRSWQAVMAVPAVAAALEQATTAPRPNSDERPLAVVCGCALGYMACYFRAIGVDCLGIDLLSESMVDAASAVLTSAGLAGGLRSDAGIEVRAGDATALVPPRPALIVWLNDEVWAAKVRRRMLARAAGMLSPGGVIVSYGKAAHAWWRLPRGAPRGGLRLVGRVAVPVSWQSREELRVLAIAR